MHIDQKEPWKDALDALSDDERQRLDLASGNPAGVLQDILCIVEERKAESRKKQLKFSFRGKTIVLRDVFEKMAVWVSRFIVVGDMAVQYDPGHAALPWAAVRFILQATIADIELFGLIMHDTEVIANTITRCAIQERLYLGGSLKSGKQIQEAIKATYVCILRYLCELLKLLKSKAHDRFFKANSHLKDKMEQGLEDIFKRERETRQLASIAEAEKSRELAQAVDELRDKGAVVDAETAKRDARFLELLREIDQPIKRIDTQISEIRDDLENAHRNKILHAVSSAPYPRHHKAACKDRMEDSGQWLLSKTAYLEWRASSASSVLWLHGIPGSGKTKLTSLIVDTVMSQEQVAYFYCARGSSESTESYRAQADAILASLVRQLASTPQHHSVLEPVVRQYKDAIAGLEDFGDQAWTADECLPVLLELLAYYPSVTIVLDALDEVDQADRPCLLDTLTELVNNSGSLVKVFISSRENYDIVQRLRGTPNVYIHMDENAHDIKEFIEQRLNRARLLRGEMHDDLRERVAAALRQRAQGMFRMVDLQIETLSKLKTARDIEARLHTLPVTLEASYRNIYDEIRDSGEHAFALAKAIFQWLLECAKPLDITNFASIVSHWPKSDGYEYTASDIQDVCSVFISVDEDSFRFSHLTVREFFENRAGAGDKSYLKADANAAIASACLSYLLKTLGSMGILTTASENTQQQPCTSGSNAKGGHSDGEIHSDDEPQHIQTQDADSMSFEDIPGPYPLKEYTTHNWNEHVRASGSLALEDPLARQIRSFIIHDRRVAKYYRICAKHTEALSITSPANGHVRLSISPIYFAIRNNMDDLVRELLIVEDVTTMAYLPSTPLWYTIEMKRPRHLQMFLAGRPRGLVRSLSFAALKVLEDAFRAGDRGNSVKSGFSKEPRSPGKEECDLYAIASARAEAIVNHQVEGLAALLEAIAVDDDLLHAVGNGFDHVVRYLLSHRIGERHLNKALIRAYSDNNNTTAELLLDFGAKREKAAVARALKRQLFETATRLTRRGYEVNGRFFNERKTALHYAVEQNRIDIVRDLLQHGAKVRVFDRNGAQPHHVAASLGSWSIVRLLQEHGADLALPDRSGWIVGDIPETATPIEATPANISGSVSSGSPEIASAGHEEPIKASCEAPVGTLEHGATDCVRVQIWRVASPSTGDRSHQLSEDIPKLNVIAPTPPPSPPASDTEETPQPPAVSET